MHSLPCRNGDYSLSWTRSNDKARMLLLEAAGKTNKNVVFERANGDET